MAKRATDYINIEGARIGFRNFSGKEGQFNPQGNRNFVIFLDTPLALQLQEEGWNVRWLDPREEGEEKQAILQVKVQFSYYPPKIILVGSDGLAKSELDEKGVDILDWADIENVDLTIRPYEWNVRGKSGIKAYLKTMYVKIQEDPWESKYNSDFENPPDSAQSSMCEEGYEYRDGACRPIEG